MLLENRFLESKFVIMFQIDLRQKLNSLVFIQTFIIGIYNFLEQCLENTDKKQ